MKSGSQIKLLITDFDGTLVDTFMANFKAYEKALFHFGISIDEITYRQCFGLRFKDFMNRIGLNNELTMKEIKELKSKYYPLFFDELKVNASLLDFIKTFRYAGYKTAIASTASRENLMNVLSYIKAGDIFDYILSGEEVREGKPNPEVYLKILEYFNIKADCALVFEDSETGVEAAQKAGINYVIINSQFYGN